MRKTTNFFTSQRAFCCMASLCDLNCVEDVITRRRIFQSSFQMWVRSPRIHGQLQGNSPSFAILSGFFNLFYLFIYFFAKKERLTKLKGPKERLRGRLNKVFGFGCFRPCCWSVGTACFTTHENKPCNLIYCKTGSNVGGRTPNIAIQLALQWHAVKTSCTFFCCPLA